MARKIADSKTVQAKIKKIHEDEPDKPMKAVIGKAYGMVRNKKKR